MRMMLLTVHGDKRSSEQLIHVWGIKNFTLIFCTFTFRKCVTQSLLALLHKNLTVYLDVDRYLTRETLLVIGCLKGGRSWYFYSAFLSKHESGWVLFSGNTLLYFCYAHPFCCCCVNDEGGRSCVLHQFNTLINRFFSWPPTDSDKLIFFTLTHVNANDWQVRRLRYGTQI